MRGLLDTNLLEGPIEVYTKLRPKRYAIPVPVPDAAGFETSVQASCQFWGGASWPLLPIDDKAVLPELYSELLKREAVDDVQAGTPVELPRRVRQGRAWATPLLLPLSGNPLLRDSDRVVEVVAMAPDDPWRQVYLATLGSLPLAPSKEFLDSFHLRDDLRFEEFFRVERPEVAGSVEDLAARLGDASKMSPRRLSSLYLASGMKPDTSFLGSDGAFPSKIAVRRAAGPNIVVVVKEGSVDDLVLLWNLRAAHGDDRAMPIGIPLATLSDGALQHLQEPGRAAMFGLGGGKLHLTSWSVPLDELQARVSFRSAVFASPHDLLTFGPAPGRSGSQMLYWSEGRASVMPMSESDADLLRPVVGAFRGGSLVLDVSVNDYPMPCDQTMRGPQFGPNYCAGSAQVPVSDLREKETVDVAWPSGWTALAAAAQTRGLSVKASDPGMAAIALLQSLGGVDQVRWLLHEPLVDLFYRLAERSGMSWWKRRWKSASEALGELGVDDSAIAAVAASEGRDEPAIAPPGEGRELGLDEFRKALGGKREAAAAWVAWAERKHLLVRGANVKCPICASSSWLPISSMPPPVGCAGCGREIGQPYEPDMLKFRYRLGEPLRRVLETDSLGHIFALHWAVSLFGEKGALVGAHPGVTFIDPASGKDVGEADVLLLFYDGEMVPFEVKRRAEGVDQRAADLMDILADSVKAPWDVIAVAQAAAECASAVAFTRSMPGQRPRYLLSYRQLLESHPIRTFGADPFAWTTDDAEIVLNRQEQFVAALQDGNLDSPWDYVSEMLLNQELG